MASEPSRLAPQQRNPARRIALVYMATAAGWILTSDYLLASVVGNPATAARLAVLKGLGFVAVTAVLLHRLIRRRFTQLERAQKTLAESEERFQLAVQGTEDGTWDWDLATDDVYYSPRWKSMLGYTDAELDNHLDTWKRLVHPEDRDATLARVRDLVEGRAHKFEVEFRMRHRDGHLVDVLSRAFLSRDAGGHAVRLVGTHVDVSKQRRSERALRESEKKYRLLAENMTDVMWILDLDTSRFLYVSPSVERLRGYTAVEVLAEDMGAALTPDSRNRIEAVIPGRVAEFQSGIRVSHTDELEQPCKDGATVWTETTTRLARNEETGHLEVYGTTRDISERKRAEAALRQSQDRLKLALDASGMGVWEWDLETDAVFWSPECYAIVGLDDMSGTLDAFTDVVHPEDVPQVLAASRQALGAGGVYRAEFRIVRPDGETRWVSNLGRGEYDEEGKPLRLVGTVQDITEHRRAEEELKRSESGFRSLFENMLHGFAHCRMVYEDDTPRDFIYLRTNKAFEELTGLRDVVGKRVTQVIPGIERSNPELFEVYGRVSSSGRPERFETYVEPLDIWFSVSVYRAERDQFVAVFDNITERKGAEEAREATIELLRLCNTARTSLDLMQSLTRYFQDVTGCEAVGVRLRDGDDFPYFETRGFPREFVATEDQLCATDPAGQPFLACMCGNILSGRFDPTQPFFTARGSFWSNSTTDLLATTTPADRQSVTRNRCNSEGYESMALIPLRTQDETFGLFQFNDPSRGRFTPAKISFLEDLMAYVAIALAKLRTEEALDEASQFREQIVQSAEEGIIVYGADLRIQVWNPFMERMSGLPADEVLGRRPEELFPFLREAGVLGKLEAAFSGQASADVGVPYRYRKSGRSGWASGSRGPLRNAKGEITGVIATVRDVTEQQQAEEALRAERDFSIGIIEGTPAIICGIAPDGTTTFLNPAGECATGYRSEELLGKNWWQTFYPGADYTQVEQLLRAFEGGDVCDYEMTLTRKDGAKRTIAWNSINRHDSEGRLTEILGFGNDVTDRKEAEKQLKESEAKFRTLAEASSFAIMIFQGNRWVYTNPAGERISGFSKEELYDMNYWDFAHPDDEALVRERGRRDYAHAATPLEFEFKIITKNGQEKWVHLIGSTIRYQGAPAGLISVVDTTERKRGAERLAHLNRVLLAIRAVEQVIAREKDPERLVRDVAELLVERRGYRSVVVIRSDASGAPRTAVEKGLGRAFQPIGERLSEGELPPCCEAARTQGGVFHVTDRELVCAPCAKACGERVKQSACVRLQYGETSHGYLMVSMEEGQEMDAEEESLFVGLAGDVALALHNIEQEHTVRRMRDERDRIEAELRQAQKMEAVGRLAGGVAHDFNNMLSVILGFSDLSLAGLEPLDPLRSNLLEIQKATERSTALVRQLLAFSRKQVTAPVVLRLNDAIAEQKKMLARLIGEDVAVDFLPAADLWNIRMDPSQMDQILANLMVNARDAIAGVGKVTLETANAILDDEYVQRHPSATPGEYVMLAFSDTGIGMDEATRERVFEPFFTTKGEGQGTGLGLATVYGIVTQNDGLIHVYSEPNVGTTFKLYFPRHRAEAVSRAEKPTGDAPVGTETVLLVEDEEQILQLAKRMLERCGYTVLAATNPGEACVISEKHPGDIHLLLSDVVMPTMNGSELKMRIEASRPKIRTLFMSGYTSDIVALRGVAEQGVAFLHKPFSLRALAAKVRGTLDA